MPEFENLGAVPAIGFAMWHLSRGMSQQDVEILLETHKDYASLGPIVLNAVVQRAADNLAATNRLNQSSFRGDLVDAIGKPIPEGEPVGVRVTMSAIFADGHEDTISVTINANGGMTPEEVQARAEFFVLNGGLNRGRGPAYEITSVVSTIDQIIEGGLPSAALNLMEF